MSYFTERLRDCREGPNEIYRENAADIIDEMERALKRLCTTVKAARLLGNIEEAGEVCRGSASFSDFEAGYEALLKLDSLG